MTAELDHLVLAVPDLDAAVEALAARAGVRAVAGGSHPGRGTRNALLGLTWRGSPRHYLELLAPDPDQPDVPPAELMLDLGAALHGGTPASGRLHTWAVRPGAPDLDATLARARAAGLAVGEPVDAARDTPAGTRLTWRLAVPRPPGLGGVQPFLIDWRGGAHPTDDVLPTVELVSLTLLHPEPERAAAALQTLGVDHPVHPGERPGLRATLATPRGEVLLT